jgi:transposase-like protein
MSMRRSCLNERQKAVALLVALGQFSYRQIAKQVGINRNSVTLWLKNAQVLALVAKFQADIEEKMEDQALLSVTSKNTLLLGKALQKMEQMLESKSQKKQMAVIKFLLGQSGVEQVMQQRQQDRTQRESNSPLRLSEDVRALLHTQ